MHSLWLLWIGFAVFGISTALPISLPKDSAGAPWLLGICLLLGAAVITVGGCLCCKKKRGFQEFKNETAVSSSTTLNAQTQFPIFRPLNQNNAETHQNHNHSQNDHNVAQNNTLDPEDSYTSFTNSSPNVQITRPNLINTSHNVNSTNSTSSGINNIDLLNNESQTLLQSYQNQPTYNPVPNQEPDLIRHDLLLSQPSGSQYVPSTSKQSSNVSSANVDLVNSNIEAIRNNIQVISNVDHDRGGFDLEDNNNGPISELDIQNIANNNAVGYIRNQNEILEEDRNIRVVDENIVLAGTNSHNAVSENDVHVHIEEFSISNNLLGYSASNISLYKPSTSSVELEHAMDVKSVPRVLSCVEGSRSFINLSDSKQNQAGMSNPDSKISDNYDQPLIDKFDVPKLDTLSKNKTSECVDTKDSADIKLHDESEEIKVKIIGDLEAPTVSDVKPKEDKFSKEDNVASTSNSHISKKIEKYPELPSRDASTYVIINKEEYVNRTSVSSSVLEGDDDSVPIVFENKIEKINWSDDDSEGVNEALRALESVLCGESDGGESSSGSSMEDMNYAPMDEYSVEKMTECDYDRPLEKEMVGNSNSETVAENSSQSYGTFPDTVVAHHRTEETFQNDSFKLGDICEENISIERLNIEIVNDNKIEGLILSDIEDEKTKDVLMSETSTKNKENERENVIVKDEKTDAQHNEIEKNIFLGHSFSSKWENVMDGIESDGDIYDGELSHVNQETDTSAKINSPEENLSENIFLEEQNSISVDESSKLIYNCKSIFSLNPLLDKSYFLTSTPSKQQTSKTFNVIKPFCGELNKTLFLKNQDLIIKNGFVDGDNLKEISEKKLNRICLNNGDLNLESWDKFLGDSFEHSVDDNDEIFTSENKYIPSDNMDETFDKNISPPHESNITYDIDDSYIASGAGFFLHPPKSHECNSEYQIESPSSSKTLNRIYNSGNGICSHQSKGNFLNETVTLKSLNNTYDLESANKLDRTYDKLKVTYEINGDYESKLEDLRRTLEYSLPNAQGSYSKSEEDDNTEVSKIIESYDEGEKQRNSMHHKSNIINLLNDNYGENEDSLNFEDYINMKEEELRSENPNGRNELVIRYNIFNPLSPIAEEWEAESDEDEEGSGDKISNEESEDRFEQQPVFSTENSDRTFVLNETQCLDSTSFSDRGAVSSMEKPRHEVLGSWCSNDTLFNLEDNLETDRLVQNEETCGKNDNRQNKKTELICEGDGCNSNIHCNIEQNVHPAVNSSFQTDDKNLENVDEPATVALLQKNLDSTFIVETEHTQPSLIYTDTLQNGCTVTNDVLPNFKTICDNHKNASNGDIMIHETEPDLETCVKSNTNELFSLSDVKFIETNDFLLENSGNKLQNCLTGMSSTGINLSAISPTSLSPIGEYPFILSSTGINVTGISPANISPVVLNSVEICSPSINSFFLSSTGVNPTGICSTNISPILLCSTSANQISISSSSTSPTLLDSSNVGPCGMIFTINTNLLSSTGICSTSISPDLLGLSSISETGISSTNSPIVLNSTGLGQNGNISSNISPITIGEVTNTPDFEMKDDNNEDNLSNTKYIDLKNEENGFQSKEIPLPHNSNMILLQTEDIFNLNGENDPWITEVKCVDNDVMTTSFSSESPNITPLSPNKLSPNIFKSSPDDHLVDEDTGCESEDTSGEFEWRAGEFEETILEKKLCDHIIKENKYEDEFHSREIVKNNNSAFNSDMNNEEDTEHTVEVVKEVNGVVAKQDEESSGENEDESSEGSEEMEFIPSSWDALATPLRSSMKNPDNAQCKSTKRRSVVFKQEKYLSMYEYPREQEQCSYIEEPCSSTFNTNCSNESEYENISSTMQDPVRNGYFDRFLVTSSSMPFQRSQFSVARIDYTAPIFNSDENIEQFSWSKYDEFGPIETEKEQSLPEFEHTDSLNQIKTFEHLGSKRSNDVIAIASPANANNEVYDNLHNDDSYGPPSSNFWINSDEISTSFMSPGTPDVAFSLFESKPVPSVETSTNTPDLSEYPTPDSGIEIIQNPDNLILMTYQNNKKQEESDVIDATYESHEDLVDVLKLTKNVDNLGVLCHTKSQLKLPLNGEQYNPKDSIADDDNELQVNTKSVFHEQIENISPDQNLYGRSAVTFMTFGKKDVPLISVIQEDRNSEIITNIEPKEDDKLVNPLQRDSTGDSLVSLPLDTPVDSKVPTQQVHDVSNSVIKSDKCNVVDMIVSCDFGSVNSGDEDSGIDSAATMIDIIGNPA